jgi:preprotein translocase subunit SecB|tara:strand:+ start:1772 stop:2194 length:423 start_codon:yes stop_codon:yes gene_type:complete
MQDKFKIIAEYVKDISSETPNIDTYLFVKEKILKYNLSIEINSVPLKNNMIEVNTKFMFSDPENSEKKSYFEILYSTIIKLNESVKDKKEVEKIILVDVQKEIYPNLEKTFLDTVRNSGYKNLNIDKKPDFEKLYLNKKN